MNTKKSKKANLEGRRILFFEIGLIISLAFVLMAFEWKWADINSSIPVFDREIIVEEDMIGTYEKKKIIIPPKPIVMIPIPTSDEIDPGNELLDFTTEDFSDAYNDLDRYVGDIEEIEEEDDVVYVFVQKLPEFPGGESALMAYLAKKVHFCISAKEAGISGSVYVSFVVWKDGSIRNIQIKRKLFGCLDESVLAAVHEMPKWEPGMQNGKKVNVEFNLPVKFTLK